MTPNTLQSRVRQIKTILWSMKLIYRILVRRASGLGQGLVPILARQSQRVKTVQDKTVYDHNDTAWWLSRQG